MWVLVNFIDENEGCTLENVQAAFPEEDPDTIKQTVVDAYRRNLLRGIKEEKLLEGPIMTFGFLFCTAAGKGWLERTRPRWRR